MRKISERIKHLGRFILKLISKYPRLYIGLICVILLTVITQSAGVYLSKILIDKLQAVIKSLSPLNPVHNLTPFITLILLMAVCRFGASWFEIKKKSMSMEISEKIAYSMQEYAQQKSGHIERICYEDPKVNDLISRVKNTLGKDSAGLLNSLVYMVQSMIFLCIYSIMLWHVAYYFPLILISTTTIGFYTYSRHGYDEYFLKAAQSRNARQVDYLHSLISGRSSAKEIRTFGLAQYLINRLIGIQKKLSKEELHLLTKYTFMDFLGNFMQKAGLAVCAFITAMRIMNGQSSTGDLLLVLSIGSSFFQDIESFFTELTQMSEMFIKMDDISAFEKLPQEQGGNEPIIGDIGIKFSDVTFSYPGCTEKALSNINAEIRPGEVIALVGENGSGKTTFVHLLLGLFKPQKGEIAVNNVPMNDVRYSMRSCAAVAFQHFNKYQTTVRENLMPFQTDAVPDSAIIKDSLLDFIDELPEGIDTKLGQLDRGAVELSGGQWQRLAIGRLLLKPNTRLLVLDEPTAALDPLVKSKLYENLHRHIAGRTTIITSHRLGVCSLADRIFVFDKGHIVEQGTHLKLMEKHSKYYSMYKAQQSLYNYAE